MYQHPLARLLIYTDKRDKSEFGIPKQAWYDLYELFTKTKYDNLDDGFTAVDFFNEVFMVGGTMRVRTESAHGG